MAETMTKGRGRQGKAWTAPPKDNIYITFVLRLPVKVFVLYLLRQKWALPSGLIQ